ncbi:NAD-dependent epimerase/dehydratase family protein [Pseudobythopirellula maris]|uniref:NAD-dependent epimerase/dehydratase family protein n=1 Tax=Pseudobythopirellula maris TaxID=2527991 RepID=UPI0018D330EF|nr:NAD(P)-dependent oxidoreductase [Pseudobythopirellula maris]
MNGADHLRGGADRLARGDETRTLVTGGTGFLGSHLTDLLSRTGREVLAVSRGDRADCRPDRMVDVLDRDALAAVFRDFHPHEVVHLAATSHFMTRDDDLGYRTNVDGTANVIGCVADEPLVRRCLIASSHVVANEDLFAAGEGRRYADSKRAIERLVGEWGSREKVCVTMRPCSIWGPGCGVPFRGFFERVIAGRYFHPGNVDPPKRMGYVKNTVFQMAKLLEAPAEFVDRRMIVLADDETTTLREWSQMIAEKAGRRPPPAAPEALVRAAALAGDALKLLGYRDPPIHSFRLKNMRRDSSGQSIEAIRELTGALPYTLEQGVEETVAWFKNKGAQP